MFWRSRGDWRTFLGIYLHSYVEVDCRDDEIAHDVECAHTHEHSRVVEGDLLARLHHPQDDDQIGTAGREVSREFLIGTM